MALFGLIGFGSEEAEARLTLFQPFLTHLLFARQVALLVLEVVTHQPLGPVGWITAHLRELNACSPEHGWMILKRCASVGSGLGISAATLLWDCTDERGRRNHVPKHWL